eukprot:CAMPEP_0115550722 /NCGR_PEP_ID=MMETSP0271-20121206/95368_1 /TAXON_ID=71861 /ORGANISM="Scrippsiella trochoidea, Strain CCMP3099" /LENGTH=353 /DNA_ID=CAMNT_0002984313 /DNA_START=720 /DNA_END=1781 /DNA_ORIENTATION=+
MEEAMMVSCVCFQIVRSFMRTVPMPWPALEGLLKFLWQKAPKSSCKHGLKWSNTKSTLASSMQSRAAEEEAPSSSGAVEMTLVRISLKAASSSKSGHKAWEVRARALQKSSYVSLLAPWSQLCTTLWKMMSASARVMDCSGDETPPVPARVPAPLPLLWSENAAAGCGSRSSICAASPADWDDANFLQQLHPLRGAHQLCVHALTVGAPPLKLAAQSLVELLRNEGLRSLLEEYLLLLVLEGRICLQVLHEAIEPHLYRGSPAIILHDLLGHRRHMARAEAPRLPTIVAVGSSILVATEFMCHMPPPTTEGVGVTVEGVGHDVDGKFNMAQRQWGRAISSGTGGNFWCTLKLL